MHCLLCQRLTLHEMGAYTHESMQPHQPSLYALIQSAKRGCQLCDYFWRSMGNHESDHEMLHAKNLLYEEFPGRALSVNGWVPFIGNLDSLYIMTTGNVADTTDSKGERRITHPMMRLDGQITISGYVDTLAIPGMVPKCHHQYFLTST